MNAELKSLADLLTQHNVKIAVAESCTGGYLSKVLTDLPGSSAWFAGGIVAYSNDAKRALLNVRADVLERRGAVSEEVVAAMCAGALRQFEPASVAVSVSGNAGPSGEPLGKVCFGVQSRGADAATHCAHFDGDRERIRSLATREALVRCFNYLSARVVAR